jgi:leucyl aminopeptidase (aminopeptidase T)
LIAEVGIGVNPSARLTGNSILDEKSLGTAHVAFGGNTGFGGANAASVHIDGIMRESASRARRRAAFARRWTNGRPPES